MTDTPIFTVEHNTLPQKGDWCIRYNPNPASTKNEDGTTTVHMNFPILIATDWVGKPEETLQKVADQLNTYEQLENTIKELIEAASDVIENWSSSGALILENPSDKAAMRKFRDTIAKAEGGAS
ncbi:MAG: hypothetical protein GYB52_09855 [Rhodospirillales bacterium]|nr:hypothetical protein [Rhodospirillales bacterium]MBR9816926.1 hypothetical protein [Rhodospirillales bacterium]